MYSNLEIFCMSAAVGVFFLLMGLLFGFLWGESSYEKTKKAEEQADRQQKMWNEYISALKGGSYGK